MTFTFDQAHAYFAYRLSDNQIPHRGTFSARCPFHGDRTASLSVNLDKGGLWNCHACNIGGGIYDFESQMFPTRSNNERWEAIYKITGAEPSQSQGKYVPKGSVIATYQYVAPDGKLLFEKQRHEPKSFTQRAPNGSGGWKYSLEGVRKVLYRLPEVMAAQVVFIAEGEKDVEALRALELEVGYKVAATCNFDGAGKWKDEYSPYFAGKRVVIFPDNDEPGRLHAQTVATSALKFAESVKVVELPGLPEKGDVADFLKDHTAEDLMKAVASAPRFRGVEVKPDDVPFFVSAAKILPKDAPSVHWLIPGAIHRGAKGLIVAPPKAGKSMIALDLAVSLSSGLPWIGIEPEATVKTGVVSREDAPGMTADRLKQLARGRGLDFHQLPGLFVNTFQQRASFSIEREEDIVDVCKWIKHEGIELCIFDVLNKLHTADENDNTKMTAVMARFDRIRTETGCDVAVIHHDAKNSAPGAKKPRGASSIDSWWDWKISVNVDPGDDSLKHVFFGKMGEIMKEDWLLYSKLFTKILDSSIWLEDSDTRIVWITLLAVMDQDGFCRFASPPNIARRARVSPAAAVAALKKFEAPDPLSPEGENEGRRIERVAGGYIVLNAVKHRRQLTREETRKQDAERARRYRERKRSVTPERDDVTEKHDAVTEVKTDITHLSRKQVRESIAAAVKETVERARALAATTSSRVAVAPMSMPTRSTPNNPPNAVIGSGEGL